eukprot:7191410-Heterocapsa_arctica.AAC.1
MAVGLQALPVAPVWVTGLREMQAWSDSALCQLRLSAQRHAIEAGRAMPSSGASCFLPRRVAPGACAKAMERRS